MRRALEAAVVLTLTGVALHAEANMAAVQRRPARLGAPAATGPNPLRVDGEQLSFDCRQVRGAPVCAFEARYRVSNPDRERHQIAAAFLGVATRHVVITIDGARARGAPTAAEMDAIVAAAEPPAPVRGSAPRSRADVDRWGFTLTSEPGAKHEIVVTGEIVPGRRFIPEGYGYRAVAARHMLFGQRVPEHTIFDVEYLISPLRTWKGDPRIDVSIKHPAAWRVTPSGSDDRLVWTQTQEGSIASTKGALNARGGSATLEIEIEPPAPVLARGGPLAAIGGTVGGARGVRGRIGYEFAAPSWLLYSATADTNFRDRFILTPMVEAASPAILFIPSFGFGIGAPLQVSPEPRVGVRLQGDLHLYLLGFVTSVDIYPRSANLPGFTEVSLLAQIGL